LASAACALAPNVATLITARTIQGAGSALVTPLAVSLLTMAFPVERRGPVVGLFTAITGLAVVGGPVVGGAVAEGIAWQWIFWINVPIGALLVPLALARISEVELHVVERVVESLDTLALLCRGSGVDRAAFTTLTTLAIALDPDPSRTMAGAEGFMKLYDSVPVTAAQRALRFWKVRSAA